MSMPLVTIVTVVKDLFKNDRVKMFEQAVKSVRQQKYNRIEHLVVDGASDDGTVDLLQKMVETRRITRFLSRPDSGIYEAMNLGVREAKGKYVAFLNSDDYYHNPAAVTESVNALESTRADFSFGTVLMTKVEGRQGEMARSAQKFHPFEAQFFVTMPFSHQSMFCRRDVLIQEPFDDSLRLAADLDLIIRLYMKGYNGVNARAEIATYRMSGASSEQTEKVYAEYLRVFRKNFSRYVDFGDAEILRMLHEHVLHEQMIEKVLPAFERVNPEQYRRVMSVAAIDTSHPSAVKRVLKGFCYRVLPGDMFWSVRASYRDYFDTDIPFDDTGYYLFNLIPIAHVKRSLDHSIFKFSAFGICLYKNKETWKS